MRYVRRDANHASIVKDLEKRGIKCLDLAATGSGICDIVTYYRGNTVFVEIKFGKDAVIKKTQVKFLSEWMGYCGIARSIEAAHALATEPDAHCLTLPQKDRLAGLYLKMDKKEAKLNPVERMLNA